MIYKSNHPKTITAKLDNDLNWLENHLGEVLSGKRFMPHTVEMTKTVINQAIDRLAEF